MQKLCLLIALSTAWLAVQSLTFAQTAITLPLKREQLPPFPLKLLADSEEQSQEDGVNAAFPVGLRSSKIAISLEDISITGTDKGGQPWTVKLDNQHIGLGYKLYSGDLDQNSLVDLVLVTYTGANGVRPASILSILTFDLQGRPLLWQAGQNVNAEKTGIAQLLDLDSDGKAELVTEHFDDEGFIPTDGYFINDIYKLENNRWRRLKQFGEIALPVYAHASASGENAWLIRPPAKLAADRHPFAPDLSNATPVAEGKAELNGLVKVTEDEVELVRADDRCTPEDFILVEDTKLRRSISILSGSDETRLKPLLMQLKVKLYGNCTPGKLSPRLIWITK